MCIVFLNEKRPPTASQDKETVSMYIHRKNGWFWLLIGLIKNMSGNRGLEFQDAISLPQQEDVL